MVHFAMIFVAAVQLYLLWYLLHGKPAPPMADQTIPMVFTFVGILDLAVISLIRSLLLKRSVPILQQNATEPKALNQWRTAMILGASGAYSLFLFGWVLCFLGAKSWSYGLMWGLAALAFYVYIPQLPVDEMSSMVMEEPKP